MASLINAITGQVPTVRFSIKIHLSGNPTNRELNVEELISNAELQIGPRDFDDDVARIFQ